MNPFSHFFQTKDVALPHWLARFAVRLSLIGSVLIHLVAIGLLWWLVQSREDLVILRYNAYLGIDLLGVWWQLFLVPGVTFFFVLFNTGLSRLLTKRGYSTLGGLLLFGNLLLSGAAVVVALALSFINV
ncbi:MAG: hypothetical protein E6R05_03930 [Candidatus Moraniibacteriota bacterium]|nr:MAG: hypothetical protein E6R05_03930 [Candidatus Moranbacteria bacterium]